MAKLQIPVLRRPWRRGLLTTTALSVVMFATSQLWIAGSPQWAFLVGFLATWILLSVLWANDDYIEESGNMLADVVDHNFGTIQRRILKLEKELAELSKQPSSEEIRKAA